MDFLHYFRESDEYMRSLLSCMDRAHAAEKMMRWDGQSAVEGPYLSLGAGAEDLPRNRPYCLRLSSATSKLLGYQFEQPPGGSVRTGNENQSIAADRIIPTVAICMQFALLEAYDFAEFERFARAHDLLDSKIAKRYTRKPVGERLDTIESCIDDEVPKAVRHAYASVANLRNTLTHEPHRLCNSPWVAIDVYVTCQAVADYLNRAVGAGIADAQVERRRRFWPTQLDKFTEPLTFVE